VAEDSYSLLCRDRDHAAYAVVGAAHIALSLDRVELLREYLENFEAACLRVEEFHKSQTQKKENSNVQLHESITERSKRHG
jgi:hypothetical protein